MPPAFWELYEGAESAGVTVHSVARGLDTGDILATRDIPIHPGETPDSLREKMHRASTDALVEAVTALRDDTAVRRKQVSTELQPRTRPSLRQVAELKRRLPQWRHPGDLSVLLKNVYALAVYHCGGYRVARWWNSRQPMRAGIILYHRVNDFSRDVLTIDCETFAAHILALRSRYLVVRTEELVNRLRERSPYAGTATVIHFDDCYRDCVVNALPILRAAGVPATHFINTGFINTDRRFNHDEGYPFLFENLTEENVREWVRAGYEVGAHTVNHVDLGRVPLEVARTEVVDSRRQLEAVAKRRVGLFSFPFGNIKNIRPEVISYVRDAGYDALFSAHGGFVRLSTDPFDIPRLGAHFEHKPLYLLLELEGISAGQIARTLRGSRRRQPHPAAEPAT